MRQFRKTTNTRRNDAHVSLEPADLERRYSGMKPFRSPLVRVFSILLPVLILLSDSPLHSQPTARDDALNLKLWYRQPAKKWTEALPVGNGRLGAMVFGEPRG